MRSVKSTLDKLVKIAAANAFLRSRRGATALEFALLSPVLLSFLLASIQTSVIFYFDQVLQTLTTQVARQVMVGNAQSEGLTQSQFASQVCAMAPSVFQSSSSSPPLCSGLMIDVESASTYSALSTITTTPLVPTYNPSTGAITNAWSYSPGGPGSIVIVRLMYDWPVWGGPLGIGLANQSNGTHLLVGTAVVKNEPY